MCVCVCVRCHFFLSQLFKPIKNTWGGVHVIPPSKFILANLFANMTNKNNRWCLHQHCKHSYVFIDQVYDYTRCHRS